MNKKYLSKLAIISLFIFPFGLNSVLSETNIIKKTDQNSLKKDDIKNWLELLKKADDLQEKGLISEAEGHYNIACNMLHNKKYVTFIIEDIGNHYSNLINNKNYKELNADLISEFESICGKNNLNTIFSLNRIADIYSENSLNEAASELFLYVIDFKEKNPKNYIELERSIAKDYMGLGIAYAGMGKYKKASEQFLKATQINEKDYGKKHSIYAYSYSLLGWSYTLSGEYEKAQNILEEALEIREKEIGKDHPDLKHYLRYLARNHNRKGEFNIAIEIYLRGLKNSKDFYGENDISLVSYYEDLGWSYGFQGYLPKSEEMYLKAISIQRELIGEEHPNTIYNLRQIADIYLEQFKYDEAEEIYQKSLKIYEKINDKSHQAGVYAQLAKVYSDQGRYRKAIESALKQKKIYEEIFGKNNINYPTILLSLSRYYYDLNDYKSAYEYQEKFLILREKILGEEHPDFIASLAAASLFYLNIEKYEKGNETFNRANDLAKKHLYFGSPENARVIETLSIYLNDGGAYDTSNKMLEIVKDIQEYNLGKDHYLIARTYESMARNYMNLYKYNEAIEYFTNALTIREKTLGSEHPSNFSILNKLANANLKINEFVISSVLFELAIEKVLKTTQRELPYVPDSERISFINSIDKKFPIEIYEGAFKSDLFSELILFLRLNRQGLIEDIEKRQSRLAKSDINSQLLVEKIKNKTNKLSNFNLPLNQRKLILQEKEDLEKELFKSLPKIESKIVQIYEVADSIPKDGILIEFQKYQMDNNWYYLALTLNTYGEIDIIHLGSASLIENKIKNALIASQSLPEFDSELDQAKQLWSKVYLAIIEPLKESISEYRTLFISPDGEINNVPFAALSSSDEGKFLGEERNLRLLTTGRELINLRKKSTENSRNSIVLADPLFNLKSNIEEVLLTENNPIQLRSKAVGIKDWKRLPWSADEGKYVSNIIDGELLMNKDATSIALQEEISPKIVHVASHAEYLESKNSTPIENPLLRSYIVLAGANNPNNNPEDDGYLTALEITKLDWDGTEMVVVSACETGRGDIMAGEGIYGLKRAIAVSGARSSLLSLWKVDDKATSLFMKKFYENLSKGMERGDALKDTQKFFREHPNKVYRSIYIWAAFQLSGDWRAIDL